MTTDNPTYREFPQKDGPPVIIKALHSWPGDFTFWSVQRRGYGVLFVAGFPSDIGDEAPALTYALFREAAKLAGLPE